ncbi:Sensor histidine kinase YpdA [compost metagenome]
MSYFVSPDCIRCELPKLILQPFIENAFFHAFNVKTEGTIYILISKTDHSLVCEVADNGDGMEFDPNDWVPDHPKNRSQLLTGIGIQNVNHRIKLLHGESYGVRITSVKGEGTQIRIVLPLIEDSEVTGDAV